MKGQSNNVPAEAYGIIFKKQFFFVYIYFKANCQKMPVMALVSQFYSVCASAL